MDKSTSGDILQMSKGKLDNQLNLSLEVPQEIRGKTASLDVGYTPDTKMWELIVKYNGSIDRVRQELGISAIELLNEYAILTIPENKIDSLAI
jgi:hypothetical protein